MAKPRKPSPAQMAALRKMAAGTPVNYGIHGRGAYGGLYGTIASLQRRGWMDEHGITEAGRRALEEHHDK